MLEINVIEIFYQRYLLFILLHLAILYYSVNEWEMLVLIRVNGTCFLSTASSYGPLT